jgi:uncharacterized membrane protein
MLLQHLKWKALHLGVRREILYNMSETRIIALAIDGSDYSEHAFDCKYATTCTMFYVGYFEFGWSLDVTKYDWCTIT